MDEEKSHRSAIGGVRAAVFGAASLRNFSALLQKSSLDVIQAQQGEVEQVKASTCLKISWRLIVKKEILFGCTC